MPVYPASWKQQSTEEDAILVEYPKYLAPSLHPKPLGKFEGGSTSEALSNQFLDEFNTHKPRYDAEKVSGMECPHG